MLSTSSSSTLGMLSWKDDGSFVRGGTTFHVMPPDYLQGAQIEPEAAEFFICKPRPEIEEYADLLEQHRPQRIVELGVFGGGSTLFFAEIARPMRIAAIDLQPLGDVRDKIKRQTTASGLGDVIRLFGGVDQGDRRELSRIVGETFEGAALDLVVDDCSHLYTPTRASFNELFPRLHPGGLYVIEDWQWGHAVLDAVSSSETRPEKVPLTRLLFEMLVAIPALPGLIAEISIDESKVVIERGDVEVDPTDFQVSDFSNPRGRALMGPN